MTWLEPLWLAYPAMALAIFTVAFAFSVRWWLRAFPVIPVSYRRDEMNRDHLRAMATGHPMFPPIYAVTASSAYSVIGVQGVTARYYQ